MSGSGFATWKVFRGEPHPKTLLTASQTCKLCVTFCCFSVETINDGNFHIVELLAMDQILSLSIDGGSPKIITNLSKQSTLNFDSPLYVGGKETYFMLWT